MCLESSLDWAIDWWLPKDDFRRLISDMIKEAIAGGKVLALPVKILPGEVYGNYLALLLSQVHCGACDAPCCRQNPNGEPTTLLALEYRRLVKKYGAENFILKDGQGFIPMPCPFLKSNRCTIYEDRPLVCVFFPFQPGATNEEGKGMMALASICPEARRITMNVYMAAWWIRHQFRVID
jgi:Fe-S-cluster containining protein